MSNARSALAIDLNLIDDGSQSKLAPAAEYKPQAGPGMNFVPPSDGSPSFNPVQGSPQYVPMQVGGDSPQYVPITTTLGSPSFVDGGSSLCYATPQYTPTFLTTSAGGMPSNQFDSPYHSVTPDMYGTPLSFSSLGMLNNAETPMFNGYSYQRGYRGRGEPNIAVSCRVHNVVKRVRTFCMKNDIDIIKVVEGKNVMKVSVRSVLHTQKLERALTNIVQVDGIEVEAVSLPESIDVTKRKRGFLLFMRLKNFEKDEAQVLKRFAETGLDYKITLVDGLTLSTNNKTNKAGVDDLRKQVELLKLEVERLKQSPSQDELKTEL